MKRNTLIPALIAGAVLATAVPALAFGPQGGKMGQGGPRGGEPARFATLDTNGDGKITLDEFKAPAQDRFAQLDTDGDGMISPEELQAAGPMQGERAGPGARGEQGPRGDKMAHGKRMGGQERMGGHDRMGAQERMGGKPMTEERAQRMVAFMDDDGDGLLSAEELSAAPGSERMFNRLDANGDGAITEDEFQQARARLAEFRGGQGPQGRAPVGQPQD